MPKLKDAQLILASLGLPPAQQNEMSGLTLLALCRLQPHQTWAEARSESLTVSKGIMTFVREYYGREYAPNTRETFRRQVLHQFVQLGIANYNPDNPQLPTNSPNAHYAITPLALAAVQHYGTQDWEQITQSFRENRGITYSDRPANKNPEEIKITLPDGSIRELSPGEHNFLQVTFLEEFIPRFTQNALLLYIGDTADKSFYVARQKLTELGIIIDQHAKLPDIILYEPTRHWLYLVEAVTSHGPMTPKRIVELNQLLAHCDAGKIFVTAFLDFPTFRKYAREIAWETEVWVSEFPEHLIHFDGQRFLGPYKS